MKNPLITIIISNLNGMDLNLLPECLDSLTKPNYNNWELIVVDNNSTDGSVGYLKKRFAKLPNCILIQNPINMYSQGLNLGAKSAKGDYLAYFNNDVAVHKNYFNTIIKEFLNDKSLAIAQGKLLNLYKKDLIDSAGETMDIFGNPVTIGAGEKDKGQFDKIEDILSASGSACVIKMNIFQKLGGYDPDYGIGYEDMDLSLRARRLGLKVKRFPKAIVFHKRASTDLAKFIRVKVKWHFNKNRLTTMIKNYPPKTLMLTIPITLSLYLGIALYEWVVRRNWNIGLVRITSIYWVISKTGKILKKRRDISYKGAKSLGKKEFRLFSSKSFLSLLGDFVR